MRPLGDEPAVKLPQLVHRNGHACPAHGNGGILAETAAQVAAREKDGARAVAAADTGFFPLVQGRPGYDGLERTVAKAGHLFSSQKAARTTPQRRGQSLQ